MLRTGELTVPAVGSGPTRAGSALAVPKPEADNLPIL